MSTKRDELTELIRHYQGIIDKYEPMVIEARQNLEIVRKTVALLEKSSRPSLKLPLSETAKGDSRLKYAESSMPDAIKDVLKESKRPITTVDIANRIIDGGFTSKSANLRRDVSVYLNRLKNRREVISQKTDHGMVYTLANESEGGDTT